MVNDFNNIDQKNRKVDKSRKINFEKPLISSCRVTKDFALFANGLFVFLSVLVPVDSWDGSQDFELALMMCRLTLIFEMNAGDNRNKMINCIINYRNFVDNFLDFP